MFVAAIACFCMGPCTHSVHATVTTAANHVSTHGNPALYSSPHGHHHATTQSYTGSVVPPTTEQSHVRGHAIDHERAIMDAFTGTCPVVLLNPSFPPLHTQFVQRLHWCNEVVCEAGDWRLPQGHHRGGAQRGAAVPLHRDVRSEAHANQAALADVSAAQHSTAYHSEGGNWTFCWNSAHIRQAVVEMWAQYSQDGIVQWLQPNPYMPSWRV